MIYIQFWTRRKQLKTLCSLLLVLSFAPRGFSQGTPVFPSSKTNITKFQFYQESGRRRRLCGCATSKSLFIYFINYMYI